MYIVFEGIVGSGKSTQSKRLENRFRNTGMPVIRVREPGTSPISEEIRTLAQSRTWEREEMHPITNAYLYAASRSQLIHTIVTPSLQKNTIVISDRSYLSSLAYQGEAQGLGFEVVEQINKEAIASCIPDCVFYMDISVETALGRTFDENDKWEKMGKDFFDRVVVGYKKCAELDSMRGRFFQIDATGNPEEVEKRIHAILAQYFSIFL